MRSLPVLQLVVTASCVLSGVAAEVKKGEYAFHDLAAHEVIQRDLEDRTWALKTRGLLDDLGTCDGCQVSDRFPLEGWLGTDLNREF